MPSVIALSALILLAAVVGAGWWFTRSRDPGGQTSQIGHGQSPRVGTPSAGPRCSVPGAERAEGEQADDRWQGLLADRSTPWASATSGTPWSLEYVPPGAGCALLLRPSALSKQSAAVAAWQALAPLLAGFTAGWSESLGADFSQIDELIVAWVPRDQGPPAWGVVVRTSPDILPEKVRDRLGGFVPRIHAGHTVYDRGDYTWYFVDGQPDRLWCAAPRELVDALVEQGTTPSSWRVEFDQLLAQSDRLRQVNLLFDPAFFEADGRALWVAETEPARAALATFASGRFRAALWSCHVEENLYFELRLVPDPALDRNEVAAALRARFATASQRVADHLGRVAVSPFSREVLDRFPDMLGACERLTRIDWQEKQIVATTLLPGKAAANLAWGARLILAETPLAP